MYSEKRTVCRGGKLMQTTFKQEIYHYRIPTDSKGTYTSFIKSFFEFSDFEEKDYQWFVNVIRVDDPSTEVILDSVPKYYELKVPPIVWSEEGARKREILIENLELYKYFDGSITSKKSLKKWKEDYRKFLGTVRYTETEKLILFYEELNSLLLKQLRVGFENKKKTEIGEIYQRIDSLKEQINHLRTTEFPSLKVPQDI